MSDDDAGNASVRVVGVVGYDGTGYQGFQRQSAVPTVQGALEQALAACTGHAPTVVGAGRTDRGVHATGQVVAADVTWRHGVAALRRAWNAHLPSDIALSQLHVAPADFHPRRDALSRTYFYQVLQHATGRPGDRWPLAAGRSWYIPQYLDLAAMNEAAAMLLGTRDFGGLGPAPDGGHTIRTLLQARWRTDGAASEALRAAEVNRVVFTVTANAFLYRMVRRLVATLVQVGQGKWSVSRVRTVLAARDARVCPPPAPAQGLILGKVTYARPLAELRSK